MAEQLAKRFGHNPNVIGWQIDNEYDEVSFDPETKAQFQQWLKARYGTLDNLNTRWTTSYWSETYTAWNQVPIQTGYGNPGPAAELDAFCQRYMAELPAESARRDSRECRLAGSSSRRT